MTNFSSVTHCLDYVDANSAYIHVHVYADADVTVFTATDLTNGRGCVGGVDHGGARGFDKCVRPSARHVRGRGALTAVKSINVVQIGGIELNRHLIKTR